MNGNTFGKAFALTTFGESHGKAMGGIIDGCPAGYSLDFEAIQNELNRRKPGQSKVSTARAESDKVEFLSGIFEGQTTGTPIGFIIHNKDQHSSDYNNLKDVFRPSHADFTYTKKYGIRDHRGGGRASARETICRVVAGAIAKQILNQSSINIQAAVSQVGEIKADLDLKKLNSKAIEESIVRCPDEKASDAMIALIEEMKEEGDSLGGIITCVIDNCPVGLGEPVFDKLQADLAKAMLSINAVKGFEYGSGFEGCSSRGSELNDPFFVSEERVRTTSNNSGGIQGGISNGEQINFNVAFKPTASIKKSQSTVDQSGKKVELKIEGRHDPCVVPRAVPVVESMAALVIIDHLLRASRVQ
ncbi:MAG: chorismate synthase [Bacteroidetes bacterium]|nr:chorismate synthase [Bacteroidota bacterium]